MAAPLALAALSPQAITAISTLGLAAALSLGLITQQQFNKIKGSAGAGTDDIIRPGTDKWNKAFGTSKPDITTPEGYKFKWQGGEYKQLRQPGQPSFANYDKYLDLKQTEKDALDIASGVGGKGSFNEDYQDVFSQPAEDTTTKSAPLESGDVDTVGDVFSDAGDDWTPPVTSQPKFNPDLGQYPETFTYQTNSNNAKAMQPWVDRGIYSATPNQDGTTTYSLNQQSTRENEALRENEANRLDPAYIPQVSSSVGETGRADVFGDVDKPRVTAGPGPQASPFIETGRAAPNISATQPRVTAGPGPQISPFAETGRVPAPTPTVAPRVTAGPGPQISPFNETGRVPFPAPSIAPRVIAGPGTEANPFQERGRDRTTLAADAVQPRILSGPGPAANPLAEPGRDPSTVVGAIEAPRILSGPGPTGDAFGEGRGIAYHPNVSEGQPAVDIPSVLGPGQDVGTVTETKYSDVLNRIQNASNLSELNNILASVGGVNGAPQAVLDAYSNAIASLAPTQTGQSDAAQHLIGQAQGQQQRDTIPAWAQNLQNTNWALSPEWYGEDAVAGTGDTGEGETEGEEGAVVGGDTGVDTGTAQSDTTDLGTADSAGTGSTPVYGQPLPPGMNEQIIAGPTLGEQAQAAEDARVQAQIDASNQQAQIENNISQALQQGHKPDAIMAQLQSIADRTADDEIRANLMSAGFKMLSDSTNELNKGIGQAGMNNQAYNMQTTFGQHLGDSITASNEAQRYYDERADEANQLAAQRQVALDEQKDQRAAFLRDPRVGEMVQITDPETGQAVNLSAIRESNPELYNRTLRFLANASPGEIGGMMEAAGMTGLPQQFFTGEALPAPAKPDWSDPIVKGTASKVEFLGGLPANIAGAYAGMSWHDISTETGKGKTWNQNLGKNGDDRKWIPASPGGEGTQRFAIPINSLLGSDLLQNTVGILYDKNGEALDLDRVNAALAELPVVEQRQAKLGMSLLNLYQAANITGLAGVENLANYFANISGAGPLASQEALLAGIELSMDSTANQAYISLPRGIQMSPELAFIKKNGARAYVNAVLSAEGAGDGKVYQDPETGEWFDSNGNTIDVE